MEWVARYRRELGLSIRKLSRLSGVDRRMIAKVESGYHPNYRVVEDLEAVLCSGMCDQDRSEQ